MKKIECKNLVIKSNTLIEAKYRLTEIEQKIIYKLITQINKEDQDFKPYIFKIKDFASMLNTKNKNFYTEIKTTTKDLMKKVFTIKDTVKKTELQIGWFSSVEYKEGEGIIEIEFSPKLKPFLLQLKGAFTQFDIENVMQLKSGYSCRIYELLKQYEQLKTRTFSVDELKSILGLESSEYKNFYDFKKYVLEKALNEINTKTDIIFDFETVLGERKKVIAIKFVIKSSKVYLNQEQNTQEKELNLHENNIQEIIDTFKTKYGGVLIDTYVQKMIDKKGFEYIKKCLIDYKVHIKDRDITNLGADFYTFVTKGYQKPQGKKKTPSYANFEQRNYSDEYYEKFYENLKGDK